MQGKELREGEDSAQSFSFSGCATAKEAPVLPEPGLLILRTERSCCGRSRRAARSRSPCQHGAVPDPQGVLHRRPSSEPSAPHDVKLVPGQRVYCAQQATSVSLDELTQKVTALGGEHGQLDRR